MNLNWNSHSLIDWVCRGGGTLAAYAAFTFAQRLLNRVRLLKLLAWPLNLLALALLAMLFMTPLLAGVHRYLLLAVQTTAAFMLTVIGLRILDVVIFDVVGRWRQQLPVPLVVRDIARWLLALVGLVLLVRYFFPGVNLNVLAVSSIVVGYILGNATQDTLGNLFAGLALNTERPFQIGDWVTVGGHTGRVVDTTWRATRLRTKTDDYVVIPNAAIAREALVNFSRPTQSHGCIVAVGVDYDTPPNKARRVILTALRGVPEVRQDPEPLVWLTGYADFSVNFTIKFFVDDFAHYETIQSTVMDRLWYAFKREGIVIPFPIRDVRLREPVATAGTERLQVAAQVREVLGRVELFQALTEGELQRVAEAARIEAYARGEVLVREGDEGETFYLIREGTVAVTAAHAAGGHAQVARLEPGGFFGERSLLTGEKRSATVTAETDVAVVVVTKPVLAGLLQANPDLAARLAAALEKRDAERAERRTSQAAAGGGEAGSPWLSRIRRFFGLTQAR